MLEGAVLGGWVGGELEQVGHRGGGLDLLDVEGWAVRE